MTISPIPSNKRPVSKDILDSLGQILDKKDTKSSLLQHKSMDRLGYIAPIDGSDGSFHNPGAQCVCFKQSQRDTAAPSTSTNIY